MVTRREGEKEPVVREDEDGLNIISDEDDDDGTMARFTEGELCWICKDEQGRVGLDPTRHGSYDGDPVFYGYKCLEAGLRTAYAQNDGIAIIAEPFGGNAFHLYYRLDEMPAYQFAREDIEGISWLLLTIGDACARCGEQSHYAWLTPDFVDPELPEEETRPVFRNLDKDIEHLCSNCTAAALAKAYEAMRLPLLTVEMPRSAMGVLMPSGE